MKFIKTYNEKIINNKELIKVKPKDFVYHLTSYNNRESIMKNGILPMKNSINWKGVTNDYEPAIFVNNTGIKNKWFNWDSNKNRDVWKIYTKDLPNKWYIDFNLSEYGNDYLVTFENLPITNLNLIYDSEEYKWVDISLYYDGKNYIWKNNK